MKRIVGSAAELLVLTVFTSWVAGCIAEEDIAIDQLEEELVRNGSELEPPSSLVPSVALAGDYCTLYKDSGYSGTPMIVTWPYDRNDLHRVNGFGDNVSSIDCTLTSPSTLRIYTNSQWGGTSYNVTGDISDLATVSMGDKISSVQWTDSSSSGSCTLFSNDSYGGSSLVVPAGIDWNDLHRATPTAFGDIVSSVTCTGLTDMYFRLCKNDTWGGGCHTVYSDEPDLSVYGYEDNVSSVTWLSI